MKDRLEKISAAAYLVLAVALFGVLLTFVPEGTFPRLALKIFDVLSVTSQQP